MVLLTTALSPSFTKWVERFDGLHCSMLGMHELEVDVEGMTVSGSTLGKVVFVGTMPSKD